MTKSISVFLIFVSALAGQTSYDLLLKGDKTKDAQLRSGDVIYIPPVGPLVAISGSVNMPAIYEIRDKASLRELVDWAGGFAATAAGQRVAVERVAGRRERQVEEFMLDGDGLLRPVTDGDLVMVYALSPKIQNAISLRGFVAQPARFPWRQGLANLYRPNNQTAAVTLAIGLGTFLLVTLCGVQNMLVKQVTLRAAQLDETYSPQAVAAFRQVLEIEPNNPEALRGLANAYYDRNEPRDKRKCNQRRAEQDSHRDHECERPERPEKRQCDPGRPAGVRPPDRYECADRVDHPQKLHRNILSRSQP